MSQYWLAMDAIATLNHIRYQDDGVRYTTMYCTIYTPRDEKKVFGWSGSRNF